MAHSFLRHDFCTWKELQEEFIVLAQQNSDSVQFLVSTFYNGRKQFPVVLSCFGWKVFTLTCML